MKKFFADFKEFAMKGNIIDMAVGVVIGGAFGKIVTALVENIIMPLITLITGGVAVSDWKWVITPAELNPDGTEKVAESALAYGLFIQAIIDFLIIALSIFVVLKVAMKAKSMFEKKEEEAEEEAPAETTEDILKDIRAALTGKTDEEE